MEFVKRHGSIHRYNDTRLSIEEIAAVLCADHASNNGEQV
jgi:hypothetical protein